jgi:cytochrome c biogenesis protein CcmG/thiol:disulfide interchange protein DsbE
MGRAGYLALIAAFVGLLAVFSIGLTRDPSKLPSPYIDKAAPAFDLPGLVDPEERVNNDSITGQKSLVNVWATWCVGCREEHGFLMQLSESGGVPIYGINWRDDRSDALQWLERFGNPYVATGFDGDGRAGIDWGVYGAPETFLVDEQGIVLHKHLGPLTDAIWQRDFVPLLDQAGSPQ